LSPFSGVRLWWFPTPGSYLLGSGPPVQRAGKKGKPRSWPQFFFPSFIKGGPLFHLGVKILGPFFGGNLKFPWGTFGWGVKKGGGEKNFGGQLGNLAGEQGKNGVWSFWCPHEGFTRGKKDALRGGVPAKNRGVLAKPRF